MGFWSRLARTVRRRRHDEEIDEEIAFHLAMSQRDGRDARTARLRFGNPSSIHEQVREAGILVRLESLMQDVRYALRQLRRAPMFTAVAVVSLAIGIGATTALYALADAVLLRLLPVPDPGRLVTVKLGSWGDSSSVPAYEALRDGSVDVLDGPAMWALAGAVAFVLLIYGTLAYLTSQRRHEFAVRMALGASTGGVLRDVVGEGLMLTGIGATVGFAGAMFTSAFLQDLLYEVTPLDVPTLLSVTGALALIALAAVMHPAIRAARTDPAVVLRAE